MIFANYQTESQSVWTKTPPDVVQAQLGANVTLVWDYDLKGKTIFFAKWGKLKEDKSWDRSYIMRGKEDSEANVLPMFIGKIRWIANATMVIINASLSDIGIYGCSIDLNNGNPMTRNTQLEVFREYIKFIFLCLKS